MLHNSRFAVIPRTFRLTLAVLLATAGSAGAQEAEVQRAGSYLIGVGDVLSVAVWKNEDLSVTVPVRPDGMISVPLIGEIQAAGLPPALVRDELTRRFSEYLTAPAVSLVVDQIISRRVFVVGEVGSSGAYDILQPTKLMQVLAMAGGLTEYAKKDRVIVLRDQGGQDQRIEVSIKAIESGRSSDDNVLLQPGDTIIVP